MVSKAQKLRQQKKEKYASSKGPAKKSQEAIIAKDGELSSVPVLFRKRSKVERKRLYHKLRRTASQQSSATSRGTDGNTVHPKRRHLSPNQVNRKSTEPRVDSKCFFAEANDLLEKHEGANSNKECSHVFPAGKQMMQMHARTIPGESTQQTYGEASANGNFSLVLSTKNQPTLCLPGTENTLAEEELKEATPVMECLPDFSQKQDVTKSVYCGDNTVERRESAVSSEKSTHVLSTRLPPVPVGMSGKEERSEASANGIFSLAFSTGRLRKLAESVPGNALEKERKESTRIIEKHEGANSNIECSHVFPTGRQMVQMHARAMPGKSTGQTLIANGNLCLVLSSEKQATLCPPGTENTLAEEKLKEATPIMESLSDFSQRQDVSKSVYCGVNAVERHKRAISNEESTRIFSTRLPPVPVAMSGEEERGEASTNGIFSLALSTGRLRKLAESVPGNVPEKERKESTRIIEKHEGANSNIEGSHVSPTGRQMMQMHAEAISSESIGKELGEASTNGNSFLVLSTEKLPTLYSPGIDNTIAVEKQKETTPIMESFSDYSQRQEVTKPRPVNETGDSVRKQDEANLKGKSPNLAPAVTQPGRQLRMKWRSTYKSRLSRFRDKQKFIVRKQINMSHLREKFKQKLKVRNSDSKSSTLTIACKRRSVLRSPIPRKRKRQLKGDVSVTITETGLESVAQFSKPSLRKGKPDNEPKIHVAQADDTFTSKTSKANKSKRHQNSNPTKPSLRKGKRCNVAKIPVAQADHMVTSKTSKGNKRKRHQNGNPKSAKKQKLDSELPTVRKKKVSMQTSMPRASKANSAHKFNLNYRLQARKRIALANVQKKRGERQTNPTFKNLSVYSSTRLKRNVFKLAWREPFLVNMLSASCVGSRAVVRVRVTCLVKWCLIARKNLINRFRTEQKNLIARCEARIQTANQCGSKDEKQKAFLGTALHSSNSEAYFPETSYEPNSVASSRSVKGDDGKLDAEFVVKTFAGAYQAKKERVFKWQCGPMCRKVSQDAFRIVRQTFQKLKRAVTPGHLIYFLREMHNCKNSGCRQSSRKGHCLSCRLNNGNKAPLVILENIMPHYPEVRGIVRSLQTLKRILFEIDALDTAIYSLDVDTLEKTAEAQKLKGGEFDKNTLNFSHEEAIVANHLESFKALHKKMSDLPTNYCFSCERLLSITQSMSRLSNLRSVPCNKFWDKTLQRAQRLGLCTEFICHWCLGKLRANQLPPVSCLNKFEVFEVPSCLRKLNRFERGFIQRTSVNQSVSRMGTVNKKNIPATNLVQKVTGTTFHFALPLQKTLDKVMEPTEAIPFDQDHYIMIQNQPTKQNKIWQYLIDTTDLLEGLQWLKEHNWIYSEVELENYKRRLRKRLEELDNPDNPEPQGDLNSQSVDNPNPLGSEDLDSQNVDDPDPLSANDSEVHQPASACRESGTMPQASNPKDRGETDPGAKPQNCQPSAIPECDMAAMLTQLKNDDAFLEKYTVVSVYDKRDNVSAAEQYQMKKIEGQSLDSKVPFLDAMCFPVLYPYGNNCLNDERSVKVEFSDFAKAKLLSRHPQFRTDIQYLFFLLNQKTMRQLSSGVYQMLHITRDRLTKAELYNGMQKDKEFDRNMTNVFRSIPNTEQYWKKPRGELNCMQRNYGPPTFFLTLSSADYDDKELHDFLCQINGKEAVGKTLSALIAANPVDVSRFYDKKLHAMLDFLTAPDGPLGPIEHYFWRREYQGRGTQHFHLELWVRGAPVMGKATSDEVADFISKYITCSLPDREKFPELYDKVNKYQQHRCNSYCLRYKKSQKISVCRFSFPRPVTDKLVLRDVATAVAGRRNLTRNNRLYDLPRKENEGRINDYNVVIMSAWIGNVDIQYIGEESGVIGRYITKYTTKPEKSHMAEAFDEISSTKSVASRLWNIGMRGLSSRECGALEAADVLLGFSLYGTDKKTSIKWIDVASHRARKVKPKSEVDKLKDDDPDVFCPNLIDTHYPNRPEKLQGVCLYDYVKYWDIVKAKPVRDPNVEFCEYPNHGYLRKRSLESKPPLHPHLINHWQYDPNQKPEDYHRCMLLLFKPWRKIVDDLKGTYATWTEAFQAQQDSLQGATEYHEKLTKLRDADEKMKHRIDEKTNKPQKDEKTKDDQEDPLLNEAEEVQENMQDFRAAGDAADKEDLAAYIAKFNPDQLRAFLDVINFLLEQEKAKEKLSPLAASKILRRFISGVGGTGKSYLIKGIQLWVRQVLKKDVLIMAPTGVAAYGINGFTIHRILQLPVEHNGVLKYTRLNDTVLNALRVELKNVVLIIIDEISMVSNIMLAMIHLRLCEIYNTFDEEDGFFGRMNMLFFGDLLQLTPVNGKLPFEQLTAKECNKHFSSNMSAINLWRLFDYDELQINMRQKTDEEFCSLLANVRLGFVSEENLATLRSRQIKFEGKDPLERRKELARKILNEKDEAMCLLPTRKMCAALNETVLSLIEGECIELKAEDSMPFTGAVKQKVQKKMKQIESDSHLTADLETKITIKVGARTMLKRNIDVSKGYVNGAIGKVLRVKHVSPDRLPASISLQMKSDILDLQPVKAKFQILPRVYVWRTQYPLVVAYAITVHKGQGLSLIIVYADCGNHTFSCGQTYVSLSRGITLEGTRIINFDPSQVKAHPGAIKEYARLRAMAPWLKNADIQVPTRPKKPKVKDTQWATFEVPVNAMNTTPTPKKSKAPLLPSFENADGASGWANAILQCLLSHETLRSAIINSAGDDPLKKIASQFSQKKTKLTAYGVRQKTGAHFAVPTRRDPNEFLCALLDPNDTLLHDYTWFMESHETRCDSCNMKSEKFVRKTILQLPIDPDEKNITQLIDKKLSSWSPSPDGKCPSCLSGNSFTRVSKILEPNDILVVQLQLWKTVDDESIKNTRFRLNNLPSTDLNISGNRYRLHSVLFHHGTSVDYGHCTAIVRSGKKFVRADDIKISECSWPRGSVDAYLLFYISIGKAGKQTAAQAIRQKGRSKISSEAVSVKNTNGAEAAQKPKAQPIKRKVSATSVTTKTQQNQGPPQPSKKLRRALFEVPPANSFKNPIDVDHTETQGGSAFAPHATPFAEKTTIPVKSKTPLLPGFQNADGVSCYANASLQSLLSYEPLRLAVVNSVEGDTLKEIAVQYDIMRGPLSAVKVREDVGPRWSVRVQQDVPEFLMDMINLDQNVTLQAFVTFTEKKETKCFSCNNHIEAQSNTNCMLMLPVIPGENNITQYLDSYCEWSLNKDRKCRNDSCKNGLYSERTVITIFLSLSIAL